MGEEWYFSEGGGNRVLIGWLFVGDDLRVFFRAGGDWALGLFLRI